MIQLGFVSAILGDLSFDEVIDFAAESGFSCVELMCWPSGKADRRYAGVTHVDVASLDDNELEGSGTNWFRKTSPFPALVIIPIRSIPIR